MQPSRALGTSDRLASVVMAGAAVAALGLVAFSLLAVAGLVHRIRNPLAGIKGTTQLLLEGAVPPVEGRARRILEASERIEVLLANARAFDPDGELEVSIRQEGRAAVAEVGDRGPGLAVDSVRAFDPYVTTRPEGSWLGLSIVRTLAHANAGESTIAQRPGGGCVARLVLPVARS